MEEDRELARLFEDLRRQDEASAPSFRETLERPRARPLPSRKFGATAFAASVALLALSATAVLLSRRSLPAPRPPTYVALGHWKSPTGFLLRAPGAELLGSVPSVGRPMPNGSRFKKSGLEGTPSAGKGKS